MAIIKSGEDKQVFATSFTIVTKAELTEDGSASISLDRISIQVGEIGLGSGVINSIGNRPVIVEDLPEELQQFLGLADIKFREIFEEVLKEPEQEEILEE